MLCCIHRADSLRCCIHRMPIDLNTQYFGFEHKPLRKDMGVATYPRLGLSLLKKSQGLQEHAPHPSNRFDFIQRKSSIHKDELGWRRVDERNYNESSGYATAMASINSTATTPDCSLFLSLKQMWTNLHGGPPIAFWAIEILIAFHHVMIRSFPHSFHSRANAHS